VVLKPGASCTAAELRAYCRQRLSAFKVPASIEIASDLPRTESGKPDLIRIRDQFGPGRQL
jgi:acyl-CoA synthetase (AMP-forming)/AMP-acid ligase II